MKKTTNLSIPLFLVTLLFFAQPIVAQENLYNETFDYPAGTIPPGWENNSAVVPLNWGVNESMIAEAESPELYLGYGFSEGLNRMISEPISVSGGQALAFTYNQYLINYAADAGESIGLDVTFDDGATWQALWERPLRFLNIPPGEYVYYIQTPAAATEMKFAFRFEGNAFFINGWAIDNISLDTVVDNDLVARTISGNTSPNVGETAEFMVEVQNGGNVSQTEYTINLIDENDVIIATQTGNPIEFFDTQVYTLTWTAQATDEGNKTLHAVIVSDVDETLLNNETSKFNIVVQPEATDDVVIGNGTRSSTEVSMNFYYLNSLSQTIYLAEDIDASNETIVGIQYVAYVDNDLNDVPVEIYLGETTQADMNPGPIPASEFTPVFVGNISFQRGLNQLYIPFDSAYEYTGDNLVVYTKKSYPEQVLWVGFQASQDDNTPYSRSLQNDDQPFDALDPPLIYPSYEVPNITFYFASGALSVAGTNGDADALLLYPNPATNEVRIAKNEALLLDSVTIFDMTGRQITTMDLNSTNSIETINVSQLPTGVYMLQFKGNSTTITKQLIKN